MLSIHNTNHRYIAGTESLSDNSESNDGLDDDGVDEGVSSGYNETVVATNDDDEYDDEEDEEMAEMEDTPLPNTAAPPARLQRMTLADAEKQRASLAKSAKRKQKQRRLAAAEVGDGVVGDDELSGERDSRKRAEEFKKKKHDEIAAAENGDADDWGLESDLGETMCPCNFFFFFFFFFFFSFFLSSSLACTLTRFSSHSCASSTTTSSSSSSHFLYFRIVSKLIPTSLPFIFDR